MPEACQAYPGLEYKEHSMCLFQSVKDFLKNYYITKRGYLKEEDEGGIKFYSKFPDSPDGIPLLLTNDENLHYFSDEKMICSEYSMIFAAECGDQFLHPEMCKLRLTPDCFIRPGKENWGMISSIMHSVLPESLRVQKITNASDIIYRHSEPTITTMVVSSI